MKTSKFLLGALALFSLAACSDDKDAGNAPEKTTSAKIRVDIVSASTSRAGETFEDGTTDENAIKSAYLVFYDANKNPMARVLVGEANIKDATLVESPNVEKVKTIEAEVTLPDGRYPAYMMVFANPIDGSELSALPISVIKAQERSTYKNANGFTMNNSVYYSTDGKIQREVPVSQANFYQTEEEKNAAPAVIVYIERMAGKVTLVSGDGEGENAESSIESTQEGILDGKQLKFVVTGWGINAEAQKMYLSKIYQTSGDQPWTLTNMNTTFKFDWNDPTRHRSYWAFSPHYYLPENNKTTDGYYYPWVSDQVNDVVNALQYNSFTEIEKAGKIGGSLYTMENTVSSNTYSEGSINNNAALVSAVVTGYYTVDGEKDVTFYVHGNKIYLKDAYVTAMAKLAGVIVKADGTPLTDDLDISTVFEIVHPTTPIGTDADKGVEENKVTINFINNSSNRSAYKYKSNGTADPVAISAANVDDVNADLQALCGLASAYTEGKAYFNVPIRHLAAKATGDNAEAPGAFGVVRNHVYKITVSGFADLSFDTLGKGVLEPDDPVVPPSDPNDKFGIKADVRVLAWRLVSQKVTLGQKN